MEKFSLVVISGTTLSALLLASVIFIMVASASYPMFHYDLQRTGNVSGDAPMTDQRSWSTYIGGLVGSSPIMSDGKVFVSNWFAEWSGGVNGLYCLNETTGEIIWNNSLGGGGGASTAAISGDKLFVGSLAGDLYCINASNGTTIWNKTIEHSPAYWGVASSPLVYENMIFVTTFSNNASNNGTLHVLDFNGSELWNISTGDTFYYTSPAVADGNIFFAGNLTNHSLFCANISSQDILWRFNTSTQIKSTPAIWNNTILFASADRLYAVNITGEEVWNKPFSCKMSSPAVSNGKVYIGSSTSRLYCYNANDGSEVWTTTVNGPIYSSPVVANDTVYFGTNTPNGTIYALNATDGTLRWSYSLNPPSGSYYNIMSSPAVSDGILFIGADDGRVYAFGEKPAITAKIRIEGKNKTIWNGEVAFSNSTIVDTNGTSHYIPYPSALGALDEASKKGNFSYEVVYYPTYDALYVRSIADESDWWHYWVNYTMPMVGADKYELKESDYVLWGYSESWTPSPLKISLEKEVVRINETFNVAVFNVSANITTPVENATVYVDPQSYKTDKKGNTMISIPNAGIYRIYAEKEGYIRSEKRRIEVKEEGVVFDIGPGTYPSIFGTHYGTIKPKNNLTITKIYTYPCPGTGGHIEYVRIYGNGINVSGEWNGYRGDWHNITFDTPFTLLANHTYNYCIKTGSYPQIIHNRTCETDDGIITCEKFIDANGFIYNDWIPAIKLYGFEKIRVLPNIATVNVRIEGRNATIWAGEVTFSNSTIVDTDNVSHYLDKPTALGAVDAAAKLGNFSYEVENQTWGLFLKSIRGEAYDPSTWDGWMYRVDYVMPMVGAADFVLNETEPPTLPHKEVLWYYGSWTDKPLRIYLDKTSVKVNEQFSATVESYNDTTSLWDLVGNATVYVDSYNYTTAINGSVVISISNVGSYTVYAEKGGYIRSEKKTVIVTPTGDGGDGGDGISYWWSGSVTLPPGTFTKTAFNTGKTYTINWWTALGALQKASEVGVFSYEIIETTWGPFVYSIAGKKTGDEGPMSGWMYRVNREIPMVGASEYSVSIGNEIEWFFAKSMDTTPLTSSMALRIEIASSGVSEGGEGAGGVSPTPTPTPVPPKIAEETKTIKFIEAGGNASLTFNKTEITRIIINANNTIHNAEITIQQIEKPENVTNVSGNSYRYFNITTTNLTATNMANATIEFRVNKTWINESDIDETTITLNRYSDINNNWSALPTSKIEEDNASLYFESETQSFSLFAIPGEEKTVIEAETEVPTTEATAPSIPLPAVTPTPTPTPISAPVHIIPMFLILIVIAVIVITSVIIVVLRSKK
jgi:cobaltochelatase CobN